MTRCVSHGDTVVGIDFDAELIKRHQAMGRNVVRGDPSDADFWDKISKEHSIELAMLTLPNLEANLDAVPSYRRSASPAASPPRRDTRMRRRPCARPG